MERHHKAATVLVACSTLALASALAGCGAEASAESSLDDCVTEPATCNSGERIDGGEITWAIDGSWAGWNQTMAADNNAYLSEALVGMYPYAGQFDPDGDYIVNEGLFSADPQLVSESPVEVEYNLKDGANWGDGTEISVDDFIYHWYATSANEELCEGCTPANTGYGSSVAEITASGETVTVTYKDDYHSAEWQYEEVLSSPAHVAEAQGFDWKNDPKAMADSQVWFSENAPTWTTGPFEITSAKAGDHVIYAPNPDWAGDTEVTLDKLTFKVIEGLDSIVTELRQGTVDGASPFSVDVDSITQLEGSDGVSYEVSAGPSWEHIDLNTKNKFLKDQVLRTAVLTSIDVENIIDRTAAYVQSDAERKLSHLFRNDSEFFVDHMSATGQGLGDIEFAVGMLDDAGYTWDEDGRLHTPDGEQVELNYRYTESKASRKTTAELVQANLADLGIDVELKPIPDPELGNVLYGADFDMINFGWSTDPTFVNGASQYWSSASASNFGRLNDPVLDEILDRIGNTLDYEEAAAIANEAIAQVIADAYVLPLVDAPVAVMVNDRLVNVRDNWASQQRAMYNVAEWGVSE